MKKYFIQASEKFMLVACDKNRPPQKKGEATPLKVRKPWVKPVLREITSKEEQDKYEKIIEEIHRSHHSANPQKSSNEGGG